MTKAVLTIRWNPIGVGSLAQPHVKSAPLSALGM